MERRKRSWVRVAVAVGALALVLLAGQRFAPTALGGSASYVRVDDASMAPWLRPGDLALVRPRGSYRAGDLVALHGGAGLVVKRVVARAGTDVLLRADGSDAAGGARVPASEIAGAVVASFPLAGSVLRWLDAPRHAGLAALAVAGSALAALAALLVARRGRRRPSGGIPPIVPVVGVLEVDAAVVEVASLEALLTVAARRGEVVLEERVEGAARYFVDGGSAVFRFAGGARTQDVPEADGAPALALPAASSLVPGP